MQAAALAAIMAPRCGRTEKKASPWDAGISRSQGLAFFVLVREHQLSAPRASGGAMRRRALSFSRRSISGA